MLVRLQQEHGGNQLLSHWCKLYWREFIVLSKPGQNPMGSRRSLGLFCQMVVLLNFLLKPYAYTMHCAALGIGQRSLYQWAAVKAQSLN